MWTSGMVAALVLWSAAVWAEPGFDPKYERDYNIFNPVDRYRPDNPLNPINRYNPTVPFQPLGRMTGPER